MYRIPRFWRAAALAALTLLPAVLGPGPCRATIMVAMDVDALSQAAQVVVVGRVIGLTSAWDGGRIFTDVTVQKLDVLKGKSPGETLTFSIHGGAVDGIEQWVPGEARFKVGEEVGVFVAGLERRAYLVGLAQGKFSVDRAAPGGVALVRDAVPGGLELMAPDGSALSGAVTERPMRIGVEALRQRLQGGK